MKCPKCQHVYTHEEVREVEENEMIRILHEHGYSLRAIGKLANLHPESVKYRLKQS